MITKFLTLVTSLFVLTSITSCTISPKPQEAQSTPSPAANKKTVTAPAAAPKTTPVPPRDAKPPIISFKEDKTKKTSPVDTKKVQPAISTSKQAIPSPALHKTVSASSGDNQLSSYPLGIIGEVEPVGIIPFKTTFQARIDTGATTSSIHAEKIREFERDGKKWVNFVIINPETKRKHVFRKRVIRLVSIKRPQKNEIRYTVKLEIKLGDKLIKRNFTLSDRKKLQFPVLLGRNVLAGMAVIDVTRKDTLK